MEGAAAILGPVPNVANAALRHDWVHRLRTVFETLGLHPTEAMLARERRLQALAARPMEA